MAIVLLRNAFASTHLVAQSIVIRMYVFPTYLLIGLIGLTNSNPHFMKGSTNSKVITWVNYFILNC
jgi:hypothetical protein